MRKWLYVICIAVMVGALVFYYVYTSGLVKQLQADKEVMGQTIVELNTKYAELQAKYDLLQSGYNVLQVKYDTLAQKYGVLVNHTVALSEPTYEQVNKSLLEMKGVKIEGNCVDKVKYVQDHFYNDGLQCYVVVTNYKGGFGHATVAFNTDKGWVYVEPETMSEIKIAQDKPYYIPMRAYNSPVGMTAQQFIEDNTVTQLVVLR